MTRRTHGTFCFVAPDWDGRAEDAHEAVIEAHPYGPSYLALAIEVARLCGDEARASAMEHARERAYQRDDIVLDAEDVRGLLQCLDGFEDLVRSRLLGPDGLIPTQHLPDLRARSRDLDLEEGRGELAAYAGLEAISCVSALRNTLLDAQARGLHIAMDSG